MYIQIHVHICKSTHVHVHVNIYYLSCNVLTISHIVYVLTISHIVYVLTISYTAYVLIVPCLMNMYCIVTSTDHFSINLNQA